MKKIKFLTITIAFLIANLVFATNHVVNTQGMTFIPNSLSIQTGDSVTFINTGGSHNVNGSLSTFPNNPQGFSNPTGVSIGWTYSFVFSSAGLYNYQCDPHLPGMVGTISVSSIDCNGINNGTALVDSCGICREAYIYNFITHVPTFVPNANILVAGVDYDPQQEIVVFPDDVSNPYWNDCASNTIYDIVSNSTDHTTLKTAIDLCTLDGALSGPGPMTLFAPTDAAFNLLPSGTLTALLNDIPQLTDILKYHVVADSVMSTMLSNGQIVTTLLGFDVTVTINTNGVFINNAQVTIADIIADNGVVHIIDAVLLPPPSNTIYDIVSNSTDHTTLKTAIDLCALDGTLSGPGPMTLFAPTDAAFNLLPAGTLTALLNDIPQLTDILKYHVVSDSVMSTMLSNGQIVTTLLGVDVTVTINTNGVFINNAQVTVADVIADNGVVHIIDAVLLPPPSNTIYDIVSNSTDHTTLKTAIDLCALDGTLSGPGPMTLFAPTDAAFNLLPAGTLTALLNDIPQLTDILKYHVVSDSVMSTMLSNGQIVTTLLGVDVTVTINTNGVFIDNAQVTVADVIADNGVVHIIDAVLIPSSTSINEGISLSEPEFLYTVNLLGEKVEKLIKNQIVFDIFSDGSVIKRFRK